MTFPVLIAHHDWFTRARLHLWLTDAGFVVAEAAEGDLAYLLLTLSLSPWLAVLEETMPLSPRQSVVAALAAQPALRERHGLVLLASSTSTRRTVPTEFRICEPFERAIVCAAVQQAATWLDAHEQAVNWQRDQLPRNL